MQIAVLRQICSTAYERAQRSPHHSTRRGWKQTSRLPWGEVANLSGPEAASHDRDTCPLHPTFDSKSHGATYQSSWCFLVWTKEELHDQGAR